MNRQRPRSRRAGLVVAVPVGVLLLSLVGANITVSAQSAAAASLLNSVAHTTVTFSDPIPGPGEYLLSHTHADWPGYGVDAEGRTTVTRNPQVIDIYVPADADAKWVIYREHNETGVAEITSGYDKLSNGGPWTTEDVDDIPLGGVEALAYFDAQYIGASASRDEDNFVRITDVLRTGLVSAPVRAALFEALALIPGVSSTADVANLDGRIGVAIGRTELLRLGMRQEIIIDPDTGLVIGERSLSTFAVFGFGFNEVVSLTAIETSVVDEAPVADGS